MEMEKAFVLIHTETGKENDVLKELKKIEGVEEAFIVYGGYDIVAKLVAKNIEKLKEIVYSGRLKKIDGIFSTRTLIVL